MTAAKVNTSPCSACSAALTSLTRRLTAPSPGCDVLCTGPIFLFSSEIVNLIFVCSSTPSWAPAHLSSFAIWFFTSYLRFSCDKFTYSRIYALKIGTYNGGLTRDFQQMVGSHRLPLCSWPVVSYSSCYSCASNINLQLKGFWDLQPLFSRRWAVRAYYSKHGNQHGPYPRRVI